MFKLLALLTKSFVPYQRNAATAAAPADILPQMHATSSRSTNFTYVKYNSIIFRSTVDSRTMFW